jgi:transcriptional regulator with XRE-family HTH domain
MPLRSALAAILRLTRSARGLSQEQFHAGVEARHIHNLEHAVSSATLDTLESIASRLEIDPVALLALASIFERGQSTADYLSHLSVELQKLENLGVIAALPSQFENGKLRTGKAGRRPLPPERVKAVLTCKAEGMTQKETGMKLGMAPSTVNKIWHANS